jgi:two-component system, OmpR family, sensor kinase
VKLRVGLAVRIFTVVALALVVLGLFVVRQTRADLVAQVDDRMRGALVGRMRSDPPRPLIPSPSAASTNGESRSSARLVVDPAGRILQSEASGSPTAPDALPSIDPTLIAAGLARGPDRGPGPGHTIAPTTGPRYRLMATATVDGNLDIEATPLGFVDQNISDLLRTLAFGSAGALALVAATTFLVLRRALRPLGAMADAATRIAQGDVSIAPGAASPHRELAELGDALDSMVGTLRSSIDERTAALAAKQEVEHRLRRFVSDASHELQTPITSIRGWAELFRQGGLAGQAELTKAMGRIETEAARMGRLVDDLLTLARSDEQRAVRREQVDVILIAGDSVADARAIDPTREVTVSDVQGERPVVIGDPDALRQILDNLLSNARRYTPSGTTIDVALHTVSGELEITVSDHGPGFAPEALDHVFDRFWRSNDGLTHGNGLGLAIVRALAEAHHGTVKAANRSTGGAIVIVRLPLAEQSRVRPATGRE